MEELGPRELAACLGVDSGSLGSPVILGIWSKWRLNRKGAYSSVLQSSSQSSFWGQPPENGPFWWCVLPCEVSWNCSHSPSLWGSVAAVPPTEAWKASGHKPTTMFRWEQGFSFHSPRRDVVSVESHSICEKRASQRGWIYTYFRSRISYFWKPSNWWQKLRWDYPQAPGEQARTRGVLPS